jgi:hypothetical protein
MADLIRRTGPALLSCLALALAFAAPAVARDKGDILDDTRRRLDVERQKLEHDIQDIKREALSVARTRPDLAADLLKGAIAKLEGDTLLKTETRDSLMRSLKLTLRDIGDVAPKTPSTTIPNDIRRAETDRRNAEDEKVRRTMAEIARLRSSGQVLEASRMADDLARTNPSATAAQIVRQMNTRTEDLAKSREYRDRSAVATLSVFREIEKSGIAIEGDIEFPRDWAERSMRRAKLTEQPMTKEERAIIRALNTVTELNFKEITFQDFIDQMEKQMGVSIVVSKLAMDEANIDYTTPLRVRGRAATRTLLRKALSDVGLTFVVKDNTLQVTTPARARALLTTRSYYLGDLAGVVDLRWGLAASQAIMAQNLISLVNTVVTTIDPESWQANGGAGTIFFNPATMTLIVRQSAEVHYSLGNGIR